MPAAAASTAAKQLSQAATDEPLPAAEQLQDASTGAAVQDAEVANAAAAAATEAPLGALAEATADQAPAAVPVWQSPAVQLLQDHDDGAAQSASQSALPGEPAAALEPSEAYIPQADTSVGPAEAAESTVAD